MYIYLDESYNLKDRDKKQFISINGFLVLNEKSLFKRWNECRRPFIGRKRRIHAKDKFFDKLRLKVLKLIKKNDLTLLTVFQITQEPLFNKSNSYFIKNRLNFDKIYFDLTIKLLKELNLQEYREVTITIDNRKHKAGALGKEFFRKNVLDFLRTEYKHIKFVFVFQPSASNVLLEIADFISNILYRAYICDDEKFFADLQFKIIQIKNPLK